jgi:hypothetical protein
MKKLVISLLLIFLYNISSAQSGWGYVNYTSYKTHAGTGSTSQYPQFANTAADFVTMFNTANSNTTIFSTGQVTLAAMADGSSTVPKWGSDYFGYKFEFYFIPQETGTYSFGVNSDDASDLLVNGVVVTSFYGGHGASGYQYGSINLVAGTRYSIVARFQEYGGGEAFYLRWSRPSAPNTYSYWNNEVTNQATTSLSLNFDFGPNVDETKFSAKLLSQTNNQYSPTTNTNRTLSSLGVVNMTSDLDTIKVNTGTRATTTTGQVEWCVIYDYDVTNKRYRIGIDSREVNGIVATPSTISSLQLFDLWDGPVTFNSYDPNGWTEVYVYTNTQFNFTASSFASFIRAGNGFYGLRAEFSFSPIQSFKPHGVQLSTTNNMSSLYNSIVTVSDVWLAFKEISNGGLFGNQSGLEFTNGIQFMNGDVDGNGVFNETDAFKLLQHLTGVETIGGTSPTLSDYIKLYSKTEYDAVTKTNWNTKPNTTKSEYTPINLSNSNLTNNFNINVTWKGDVNLSHSASQSTGVVGSNSVRVMSMVTNSVSNEINASIIGEIINGKIIITISLDPLQQEVVGTQFQLNYDNSKLKFEKVEFITKGTPMNYGTNKGDFISMGSLITGGNGILDKTTEYKIIFTPINSITDILGLTSVSTTDAVNKDGKQLKVKLN